MNVSHIIYQKNDENFSYPVKVMERPYSDISQTGVMLQSVLQIKKEHPEKLFALGVSRDGQESFIGIDGKEHSTIMWI